MKPYRILVTGAREITKAQSVYVSNVLYVATARPLERGQQVVIVQGKCPKGGSTWSPSGSPTGRPGA